MSQFSQSLHPDQPEEAYEENYIYKSEKKQILFVRPQSQGRSTTTRQVVHTKYKNQLKGILMEHHQRGNEKNAIANSFLTNNHKSSP